MTHPRRACNGTGIEPDDVMPRPASSSREARDAAKAVVATAIRDVKIKGGRL